MTENQLVASAATINSKQKDSTSVLFSQSSLVNSQKSQESVEAIFGKRKYEKDVGKSIENQLDHICSQEEISQRKMYKAKRTVPLSQQEENCQQQYSIDTNSRKTQENSESKPEESKRGILTSSNNGFLKLTGGLSSLSNLSQSKNIESEKIQFKFTFSLNNMPTTSNNQPIKQEENKEKQEEPIQESQPFFSKCIKLNDEKKFFVNKNLFENKVVQLSQQQQQQLLQPPKEEAKIVNSQYSSQSNSVNSSVEGKENKLISINPLNSQMALKMQKDLSKETDSPLIKSLFEFKENQQYKQKQQPFSNCTNTVQQSSTASTTGNSKEVLQSNGTSDQTNKSNQNSNTQTLAFPQFKAKDLFGEPNQKEQQIALKPFFQTSNPFQFSFGKPEGQSSLFASGKSLFQTSNLQNELQSNANKEEQKKEEGESDGEGENEASPEPDVKEEIKQSNNNGNKFFQKPVERIKILKGISDPERKPSKKDNGFISIEKPQGAATAALTYLVFRNYMGATLFSGIINSQSSQVKIQENAKKPFQRLVKVAVMCKDYESKKFGLEHCTIRFATEEDRQDFISVFQSFLSKKTPSSSLTDKQSQNPSTISS